MFSGVQQRVHDNTVESARTAQAVVIAALDRLISTGPGDGKILAKALNAQLEMVALVTGEPAQAIDRQYGFLARLLDLHREFAQRLLEVVDSRDPGRRAIEGDLDLDLARVVPLRARRLTSCS